MCLRKFAFSNLKPGYYDPTPVPGWKKSVLSVVVRASQCEPSLHWGTRTTDANCPCSEIWYIISSSKSIQIIKAGVK